MLGPSFNAKRNPNPILMALRGKFAYSVVEAGPLFARGEIIPVVGRGTCLFCFDGIRSVKNCSMAAVEARA